MFPRSAIDFPITANPAIVAAMQSILLRLLAVFAIAFVPLRAADETRTATLQSADDARVAATLASDRTKLAAILSDELCYAHSSGSVDTKASFMDALATGRLKYIAWNYVERNFSFPAPGIALMSGRTRIKLARAVGELEMMLSFLAVWREENAQWRFLAWQSGKLPDAPAPPK